MSPTFTARLATGASLSATYTVSSPVSVYVATTGSDTNPGTQSQPVRSWDRAFHLAPSGGVVQVAAGSYAAQALTPDASKTSQVIFRPAPGADVFTPELKSFDVRWAAFENMRLGYWYWQRGRNITMRNIDTTSGYLNACQDCEIIGGDYGPHHVAGQTHVALLHIRNSTGGRAARILVDGVYFHDLTRAPGEHCEMMQIWSADDVTVRNSLFERASVYCIFVADINDPTPSRRVLIEDNTFRPGSNASSSQGAISYWAHGITVQRNRFEGGGCGPNDPINYPSQNAVVRDNTMSNPTLFSCTPRSWLTLANNRWDDGRTCP